MSFEQTAAYGNLREIRTSFPASLHSQVRRHFPLIVTAAYSFRLLLLKFIMNSTVVFLIQHELIHRRDA